MPDPLVTETTSAEDAVLNLAADVAASRAYTIVGQDAGLTATACVLGAAKSLAFYKLTREQDGRPLSWDDFKATFMQIAERAIDNATTTLKALDEKEGKK